MNIFYENKIIFFFFKIEITIKFFYSIQFNLENYKLIVLYFLGDFRLSNYLLLFLYSQMFIVSYFGSFY